MIITDNREIPLHYALGGNKVAIFLLLKWISAKNNSGKDKLALL